MNHCLPAVFFSFLGSGGQGGKFCSVGVARETDLSSICKQYLKDSYRIDNGIFTT